MAAFLSSIAIATLALTSTVSGAYIGQKPLTTYLKYSVENGYFLQDSNSTNQTTFDFIATNFGLVNRTYLNDIQFDPNNTKSQWERFANELERLNVDSPSNIEFRLVFYERHGEGYHNAAETFYTTPSWNCFWSTQNGNATVSWVDARLTPLGIQQAQAVNTAWKRLIKQQNIPLPQTYYSSPLYRCMHTANISYADLPVPIDRQFLPVVKERLHESYDMHTNDLRSNATFLRQQFPNFRFEEGFNEYDVLYRPSQGETQSAEDLRAKLLLDDIFTHDDSRYIALIGHSGIGGSILDAIGHIKFSLPTGSVTPLLIKIETIAGPPPNPTALPYTSQVICNGPPVTSLATGGCVCSSGAAISTGLP